MNSNAPSERSGPASFADVMAAAALARAEQDAIFRSGRFGLQARKIRAGESPSRAWPETESDGRRRQIIRWENHRAYLTSGYRNPNVTQQQMADHISVVEGVPVGRQAVANAMSRLGISTGHGRRNGASA